MRTIIALAVAAALLAPCPATAPADSNWENAVREAKQQKALYNAQIAEIDRLIREFSDNKEKLLISSAAGGNPRTGHWVRPAGWEDTPEVTVYPASGPSYGRLGSVGFGQILGAIRLLDEAASPGRRGSAGPGVYVIARKVTCFGACIVPKNSFVLVAYHKGATPEFVTALEGNLVKLPTEGGSKRPLAGLMFPDKEHISADNPANRVSVSLTCGDDSVSFQLDLMLEFL